MKTFKTLHALNSIDNSKLFKTNFYKYSRIILDIAAPRESRCSYSLGWKISPCMYNMGKINKIKWINSTSNI